MLLQDKCRVSKQTPECQSQEGWAWCWAGQLLPLGPTSSRQVLVLEYEKPHIWIPWTLSAALTRWAAKAINSKNNQRHKASRKSKKKHGVLLSSRKEVDEHNRIIDGERSEGDHPLWAQDQPHQPQETCWCPGKIGLAGFTVFSPKPTQKQPHSARPWAGLFDVCVMLPRWAPKPCWDLWQQMTESLNTAKLWSVFIYFYYVNNPSLWVIAV